MPRIKMKGYFGIKESMKVASATVTTGWLAGECFELSAGAGNPYSADEVDKCDAAADKVYGIALDSSANVASAQYGMTQPSASKVTILHGHSKFEIDHAAEITAGTTTAAYLAYDSIAMLTATVNDYLFTNASGKLTIVATPTSGAAIGGAHFQPVGIVTKVPVLGNSYTLGVLMFG